MENKILKLITEDRIDIPMSSLEQKLRRRKTSDAKEVAEAIGNGFGGQFNGERAYAFVSEEDKDRARGMKDAVEEFAREYPSYGRILKGKISEKRVEREKHLYFGMNPGCRLNSSDYVEALASLGISGRSAQSLYPELLEISRKLEKARDEERSVIVG